MSVKHRNQRLAALLLCLGLLALGLTACGSSGSDSTSSDATSEEASASPSEKESTTAADTESGEKIVAAADPSLLPYNFFAEGSENDWEGINVDFAEALSKQIGKEIEFTSVPFDSIIPGLQAGRYDIALTGMFDTKEREEVIEFVDYLKAKNDFLLRSDDSEEIGSFEELCGVKVGLPKGALEVQLAEEQTEACKEEGKPGVELSVFPDLNATTLALTAGRVDVVPNDSATNAYLIKETPGKFKATGEYLAEGYFAIGLPKGSPLTKEIQKGVQAMIADGELKEIFNEWGIADRTPAKATINDAAF
jgi:polar amino acid transport system substrate-binding protein